MSIWEGLFSELRDDGTFWLLGGLVLVLILVQTAAPAERRRVVWNLYALGLHLVLVVAAGLLRAYESSLYLGVRLAALSFAAIAGVGLAALLIFGTLLPRVGLQPPRILRDVVVGLGSVVVILFVASRIGLDVTGVVATSAILTAVVALSLQDTLGNIVAGLALQLDKSIQPGDWVKFADTGGRVSEIGWRFTAIETRNWETLIVPNSAIVKGNVLVLGRRSGQPIRWRRWVYFNVDFRHPPNEVIQTVLEAVRAAPVPNVAPEPKPNCILIDLRESYARYAVRYWLTNLQDDDPTDSEVRTRIFMGLRRVGIPLSIPAHAVFLTEESAERKAHKRHAELDRRMEALAKVDVFRGLSDEERAPLASGMRHAPFAKGETLTRQGAEAHWLYMIIEGEVAVRVTIPEGGEREVARLSDGDFFGEAALLTGEPRGATVIAATDVECYRLGKAEFQEVVRRRPELAQEVAETLAQRRVELKAVRDTLAHESQTSRYEAVKRDFLSKIRRVLGLAGES